MLKLKYKILLDPDFGSGLDALKAITGIKAASVLLNVAKIVRSIQNHGKDFTEARAKILADLGAGPGVVLEAEKQEELTKRVTELVDSEFEIPYAKISLKDLPHSTLSPGHVASLEPILIIPE